MRFAGFAVVSDPWPLVPRASHRVRRVAMSATSLPPTVEIHAMGCPAECL